MFRLTSNLILKPIKYSPNYVRTLSTAPAATTTATASTSSTEPQTSSEFLYFLPWDDTVADLFNLL